MAKFVERRAKVGEMVSIVYPIDSIEAIDEIRSELGIGK